MNEMTDRYCIIIVMNSSFEWDPVKEETNIRKHDVSFEEASSVFDDPIFITVLDEEHSSDEERYITIGYQARIDYYLLHTLNEETLSALSARER